MGAVKSIPARIVFPARIAAMAAVGYVFPSGPALVNPFRIKNERLPLKSLPTWYIMGLVNPPFKYKFQDVKLKSDNLVCHLRIIHRSMHLRDKKHGRINPV